jgi:hypothetical protein
LDTLWGDTLFHFGVVKVKRGSVSRNLNGLLRRAQFEFHVQPQLFIDTDDNSALQKITEPPGGNL